MRRSSRAREDLRKLDVRNSQKDSRLEGFKRARRWWSHIGWDTTIALSFIAAIEAVRFALTNLFHDPRFFDAIPVRYAFDAMDMGVLAVFAAYAIYGAYLSLRQRPDDE